MIVFTQKQEQALKLVQSEKYNFVLFGGAIRGGKTIWGLCTLLILCELFPRSRWAVVRKNLERIRKTTIPSFLKLETKGYLKQAPYEYIHHNKSSILFIGENYDKDKDLDAFKGLEVNGFLFEEINECQLQTFNKAFERAGSWIIPKLNRQPKPIILATCNPSRGWVKELIYDKWITGELRNNFAYIPAKITDNPHLPKEYVQSLKNLPKYEYEVFVNGNWDVQLKTGGEFLKEFDINKHIAALDISYDTTIHVSVDNNVYPYIAISLWQVFDKNIFQIHEICAKDPFNTASKAGSLVVDYLNEIRYEDVVFIYGDQTTTSRNTIDDEKRSFLDIFCETISEQYVIRKRIPSSNPPVALSGEFLNAVLSSNYDGLSIYINEECKESINDYILTKQDREGKVLKKRETNKDGVSFEPLGHLVDDFRYFICEAFKDSFRKYQRRFEEEEKRTFGNKLVDRRF